ncbi:hypothetical protein ACQWG3_25700, partial [Salmonella enterica subsp. enterica serovar Infantis]
MAIGLSFFSLIQYKSNKKVQSLILMLCASTFHISSLVSLSVFLINMLSLILYKIVGVIGGRLSVGGWGWGGG